MKDKEQLFSSLNKAFQEYDFSISDADRFMLLAEYQIKHLSNISKNNNEQTRVALARTSIYEIDTALKRWKRNKSKNQLFKLVNLFVITCEYYAFDKWSGEEKLAWQEISSEKDTILNNEDWYIRTIPESKWVIKYFKGLEDEI